MMSSKPEILMCPPAHYCVNYEINPWMKTWRQPDNERAKKQWMKLIDLYAGWGVHVHRVEPIKGLPDMVFTANAGLVFKNKFIASNFRHFQRRLEKGFFVEWFKERGFEVHYLPNEYYFEGQGDALFMGDTLLAGYRIRSDIQTHRLISEMIDREVISLELTHPEFYHLDTCFCPLDETHALYYPKAFDSYAIKVMSQVVLDLIPIDEIDARNFSCNAVVMDRKIILNQCSPKLRGKLEALGFEVHSLAFDQFIKAGGSAKCVSLILDTDP
ncbi:MAG: arginine deiminase-related protein [Deltaproteobacteria bacterium]|nr:arginine deiminase-related protein [Deltaproteobacteria bacterium]